LADLLEPWVLWTLLAAVMQSVRTAGQKYLTDDISAMAATMVRYLFGLPFALAYLLWLMNPFADLPLRSLPDVNPTFLISGALAGVLQIIATVLLVRLFTMRNFAVGTTYVKTEIVLTAIIGGVFFAEIVSALGWLAILICVAGVLVINQVKTGGVHRLWNQSALFGLGSGLAFALTSLFLRQASLSFGLEDHQFTAALTLVYMVVLQTVMCVGYVLVTQRSQFSIVLRRWQPCLFVGITSVVGSAGWFTAMTLERASYVKTLGQIEFLFTVIISLLFFKERPQKLEWLGMALIVVGVIVLLIAP